MITHTLLALSLAAISLPVAKVSTQQKASYLYGRRLLRSLDKQELDAAMVAQGLLDAKAGKVSLFPEKDTQASLDAWAREAGQRETLKREAHLKANKAWLTENAGKPGVRTTASGLHYRVLSSGAGPRPTATDSVVVNYRGTFLDGRVFGSSEKQEGRTPLKVNQVIKGWAEALQMMQEGDIWELFVPAELAYGNQAPANIGPDQVLLYRVELLEVGEKAHAKP
ncbi:FKBP-type peptidyl-prolyl cis-trans isomerase [Holophaga foetida]|uniref:FKBP-type peptidyl-prolyl cis-trans isomerase n=1 Tax=Holophaga foetida TaxID=35839 RepID=UPI0002474D54|nr:FKBP-type peptidyl-prolyl cis-trans isomerase [Holophaga foetida]